MRAKLVEDFKYLKPKTDEELSQALKQMCSSENKGHVYLGSLEQLPEGTTFSNGGYVDLMSLEQLPEGTSFSNGGSVDLRLLKQLPEGTTFSNGGDVYLSSLEQLPEGTTFSNGGYVDLSSLEQLPEGTSFSNGGSVDLRSLEQLPEGTTFSNGGYVDLRSLKQLPEGTTFSNGGSVDLSSLKQLPEGTTFSNGGYVNLNSLEQLPEDLVYTGKNYVYLKNKSIKGPIGVKRTDEGFTHLKPKSEEEIDKALNLEEFKKQLYFEHSNYESKQQAPRTCHWCHGDGYLGNQECHLCHGTGNHIEWIDSPYDIGSDIGNFTSGFYDDKIPTDFEDDTYHNRHVVDIIIEWTKDKFPKWGENELKEFSYGLEEFI